MNPITEADLVDYLAGELPASRRAEVTAALAGEPALRVELTELETLIEEVVMVEEPAPSAEADDRFAAMLAGEMSALEGAVTRHSVASLNGKRASGARVRSLVWKVAGVAAAVALIFLAGRVSVNSSVSDLDRALAANRTLMLELMKDERTSARIRATTVTLTLPETDPVTTANLGYLLRNDENANVRLAALDALRRFPRDPGVRAELLAAMDESPPDVVRFELIETLVRMGEKRILPYLEDIIDADSLPQPMRDAAEMASFKLI